MRQTELRNKRLEYRIPGTNGRWYNPMAPKHGIPTGLTRWGCSCEPCLAATRRRYHENQARRRHNLKLIKQLVEKKTPVAEPVVVEAPTHVEECTGNDPPPPVEAPEPEPIRVVVTEPAAPPALDWPVPPMLRAVRAHITTLEMLGLVLAAYNEPHWRLVMDGGREKRAYKDVEIIVAPDNGPILAVYKREPEPEVLPKETATGVRRAKGGRGGSKAPTTLKELLSKLPELKCTWEKTRNGHIRVRTPANQGVVMPSTASDWRSIRNSWAQLQRALREETT